MIIQGHSIIVSEPVAHTLGFIVGLAAFGFSGLFTHDHSIRLWAALLSSIMANVIVGVKINLAMLDLLGAVILRPISAGVGAAGLAMILNGFFPGH